MGREARNVHFKQKELYSLLKTFKYKVPRKVFID